MKKTILTVAFLGLALFVLNAQNKTSSTKPAPKKTTPTPTNPLKTENDSASYAIGVSVANFYKQQGVPKLNTTVLSKAINDVMNNKKVLMDDNQCNSVIMNYMNSLQASKSKPNIEAGQKFLAANKNKAGVQTTGSGLQYEIVTSGSGPKPSATDTVVVHYRGTLLDGTEFDNSYSRGEPISFAVGGVIAGWTEALQLMPVGSKWKLYIPYQLAYGASDYGPIPGGSVLVFDVELLEVKGK